MLKDRHLQTTFSLSITITIWLRGARRERARMETIMTKNASVNMNVFVDNQGCVHFYKSMSELTKLIKETREK